jgi:hypothetical protein
VKEEAVSHVTLAGDIDGEYVVEEQLPDGRLVLRPDTSVEAIRRRTGSRPMSAEEFDMHFGHLPTDARVTHAAELPAELLERGDMEAESHVMVERGAGRLGVRRLTVAEKLAVQDQTGESVVFTSTDEFLASLDALADDAPQ